MFFHTGCVICIHRFIKKLEDGHWPETGKRERRRDTDRIHVTILSWSLRATEEINEDLQVDFNLAMGTYGQNGLREDDRTMDLQT
jgi:hypothetical protein